MITLSKNELLVKYGIDLDKGQYTIENLGDKYKINILQDDTSGCILVGDIISNDKLLSSTTAYQRLYDLLYKTLKKDRVFIRIENILKPLPVIPKPVELPKEIILPTIEVKPIETKPIEVQTPVKEQISWLQTIINILKWITKF